MGLLVIPHPCNIQISNQPYQPLIGQMLTRILYKATSAQYKKAGKYYHLNWNITTLVPGYQRNRSQTAKQPKQSQTAKKRSWCHLLMTSTIAMMPLLWLITRISVKFGYLSYNVSQGGWYQSHNTSGENWLPIKKRFLTESKNFFFRSLPIFPLVQGQSKW